MLILTKSMFAMMIGFLLAVFFGVLLIPILRKLKAGHESRSSRPSCHQQGGNQPLRSPDLCDSFLFSASA